MLNVQSIDFRIQMSESNSLVTPHGSVLSPFFFNVYMTKFDRFIESLILETANKSMMVKNPLHIRFFFLDRVQYLQLGSQLPKETKKNNSKTKQIFKTGFKLLYVRHINHFLFGYYGQKGEIKELSKRIEAFFKLNLHLNCIRFKFINVYSNCVNYLGFKLRYQKKQETLIKNKTIRAFEKLKNRLTMRKWVENSKYLKILEWAGDKFYTKVVEQIIRNPSQMFVKQGINLKNVLTC
jgi:hypothetical protein